MRIRKAWTLALLLVAATRVGAATVDVEPFVKRDSFGTIKISPTGEYYAATVPLEDRTVLVVIRRADGKPTAKLGGTANSVIHDFHWVNANRVVAGMAATYGREDQPYATGELFAVNADGSRPATLNGVLVGETNISAQSVGGNLSAAFVIDTLRDNDRSMLVSSMAYEAEPVTSVQKLDVYTGQRSPVAAAPVRRAVFTTDAQGRVRFARGAGDDNVSRLYHRAHDAAEWVLVNDESASGVIEIALGLSADGATAYLQSQRPQGPDAIVAWDTASGRRTELLRDERVDPYAVLKDPSSDAPVGALFMHDGVRSRFFDESSPLARRYRSLERAFTAQAVAVTSSTADGRLLLVKVWSDRNPGDFYLFDTATQKVDLVFSRRSWFHPAKMPASRSIEFKARDGLAVHGYLTLPVTGTGPAPLVVMPHGGPFGVYDDWTFDDDAVLLAHAGYAVLRVNYRGSGNYGRAFELAGAREWGGKMQDDISDATRWAIEQRIAPPGRICIYGASYGAYAALMGVAREPDLYRCAVGYVGVYDLALLHKDDSGFSKSRRTWVNDWLGDRDALKARSPTTLAQRVKAPVFLAAGGKDERAPIEHSRRMERALREHGVDVETLYFPTEGHGFHTDPHRRDFYTRLLAFLERHIGGPAGAEAQQGG